MTRRPPSTLRRRLRQHRVGCERAAGSAAAPPPPRQSLGSQDQTELFSKWGHFPTTASRCSNGSVPPKCDRPTCRPSARLYRPFGIGVERVQADRSEESLMPYVGPSYVCRL